MTPEQLLRDVMSDFDLKILETCPVSYRCYCSRERVERALISLGRDELEQMLDKKHLPDQPQKPTVVVTAPKKRGLFSQVLGLFKKRK